MNTVFVSFDYEKDKHYKYLLEAWHANPRFRFVFDDGTPTEIDSYNVGRIKAALTLKVKAATHTLVIVGANANDRHRNSGLIGHRNWINFEINQSIANSKRIAIVMLNPHNTLPEALSNVRHSVARSFSQDDIIRALDEAPLPTLTRYA